MASKGYLLTQKIIWHIKYEIRKENSKEHKMQSWHQITLYIFLKSSPLTIRPAKLDTPEPRSDWVTQRYRSWSWLVTSLRWKEAANRLWLMFLVWATGISSPFRLCITDEDRQTDRQTGRQTDQVLQWLWRVKCLDQGHKSALDHTNPLTSPCASLTAGLKVMTTIEP